MGKAGAHGRVRSAIAAKPRQAIASIAIGTGSKPSLRTSIASSRCGSWASNSLCDQHRPENKEAGGVRVNGRPRLSVSTVNRYRSS